LKDSFVFKFLFFFKTNFPGNYSARLPKSMKINTNENRNISIENRKLNKLPITNSK
jgi:hypothetical protein